MDKCLKNFHALTLLNINTEFFSSQKNSVTVLTLAVEIAPGDTTRSVRECVCMRARNFFVWYACLYALVFAYDTKCVLRACVCVRTHSYT